MAGLAFVSTEPALAYTNYNSYVNPFFSSNLGVPMARVDIPSPSCSALSIPGLRTLTLAGIRVYDISFSSHNFNGTTVVADVQLWRYNGAAWVQYGPSQKVTGTIPNNGVYNSVVLPDARMYPQSAGYYYVTAIIGWWMPYMNGIQAYRKYSFNSASDYTGAGNVVLYTGYIYLY